MNPEFQELLLRLKAGTKIQEITDCYLWTGAINSRDRGQLRYQGRVYTIHRLSAMIYLGLDLNNPITQVNHFCMNKNCWNPKHIYVGTASDNVQDAIRIGTYRNPTAEENANKSFCKHGHLLDGDNLYLAKDGRRRCKECRKQNTQKHYQQHRKQQHTGDQK